VRFKLDENLPRKAVELLVTAGHDAVSVLDQGLGGANDRRLMAVCRDEGRALVSLDLDFSNIEAYPPEDYFGIVVLRPSKQDAGEILRTLGRTLPLLGEEQLRGRLWIVRQDSVRIRD
jgi:predicted nuclease of predicted toxin-antitoxin system